MELKFRVAARIAKPVHEVFEAVASPDQLSRYFTTAGARGRIETGAVVQWEFADFPGAFPVKVVEVVPDKRIVLEWETHETALKRDAPVDPASRYDTTVTMNFTALEDGRTLVEIAEEGWRFNEGALKSSYGNCEGWTGMLLALKMWVEHGINLREGLYK